MKTQKQALLIVSFALIFACSPGCRIIQPGYRSNTVTIQPNPNGKIPPGQLKKTTGAKSAKNYAPGLVKKHKEFN